MQECNQHFCNIELLYKECNHRKKKPYENVIGITALCSILLPDQDYFEVALYLKTERSQVNQSICICRTPFVIGEKDKMILSSTTMKHKGCNN
jgi:hypothetical protein